MMGGGGGGGQANPNKIVSGLVYLGRGSQREILSTAKEQGLDGIVVFSVLESEEGVDYCHMLYWEMCLIVHMKDKNPHRYGHNRFAGAPVKYVKNRLADALAYYEHREEQRRARSAIARA